jgi:two-component system, NtrC family, sensor histidine kinase KinB
MEFRRTNIGEVVRAKNTLESTLEALPDAVVLLDADCRILSMNRAAHATFDAAGVHNPSALEDLHLQGLDRVTIADAIKTGANAIPVTDLTRTIAITRDGATQRLLPRVVPVQGLTAQQSGAILLLYDVTHLVKLDEMRSELVAVASHELQTPLTTLRMTLLMLQEAAGVFPSREQELVATSLIGVEQLTDTVHEFLDLTRIEAGELRLNMEAVHVPALLADVVQRAQPQAVAQGISLDCHVAPMLPAVIADARRLRVVFDNLLSNALKYTPTGGSITVRASGSTARAAITEVVAVSVTDTGPGVPSAFRDRIFDKFFRLEHHQIDEGRHPRGAGIGLYMCRQIMELHGGSITCAVGSRHRGASMIVELPVQTLSDVVATDPALVRETV